MKKLKFLLQVSGIIFLLMLLISVYLLIFHTYKYTDFKNDNDKDGILNRFDPDSDNDGIPNFQDEDADNDGIDNLNDIKFNAIQMKNTLYDFSGGKNENFAFNSGFIVCYDIPRIAYHNAGLSLDLLLKEDYQVHRSYYNAEKGVNLPNTDFFFRRTRNLYSYCLANNKLIKKCKLPKPGDVIFHSRFHISLIISVNKDGTVDEIETAPWTIIAVEHKNKKWIPMDIGRILMEN